jgi:thymidylate synthase (FAD)
MKLVKQSATLINGVQYDTILHHIEHCGRVAYKSENKITPETAEPFIKNIIKRGHESVLEHFSFTFKIVTDRAIANELVRHRLASYTQESTRYVKYNELEVIAQDFDTKEDFEIWYCHCCACEYGYKQMILRGVKPQMARSVLPLSLKTELFMTANIREWRHIFKLRIHPAAHPLMSSLMRMCWKKLVDNYPIFFDDIGGLE